MDNDELPVNQNGELIMMALRDIEKPVSINKLVKFVADAAGKPENSIRQSVEETIRGGVRYGYIFEANPVDAECIETASDMESRATKSQRVQKRTHEAMDDEVVSNNDATDLYKVACSDDENCICTCKIKKHKQNLPKVPKRKYKKRSYDDEELHDEFKAKKIKKTPKPRGIAAKRKRAAMAANVDDEEPKAKKQKPSAVICKKRAAKKPSIRPQTKPVDEDEIPDDSEDEDDVNVKQRDVKQKSDRPPRALQELEELPDNNDGEKHSGKQSHKGSVVSKKCRGRFKDVQVNDESPDKNDNVGDLESTITVISKKRREITKQSGRSKDAPVDKDLSDDNDDQSDIVSIITVTKKKRRDAANQIDHCKNLEVDEELLEDDEDEDEIISTITTVTKKKRRDATKQSGRLKNVPVDDEFSDDNNGESDLESTRTAARVKHHDAKRKSGLFDKDLADGNKSDSEVKSTKTTYPIKKRNAEKKTGRGYELIPKGSDGENTTTTKVVFKKRRDATKKPCYFKELSDNSESETEVKNKNIRAAKKYAVLNFEEMTDLAVGESHRELYDELSDDENDDNNFYESLCYSKVKKPFRWADVSFVEAVVRKQTNTDNTKVEYQQKNSTQKAITSNKRNDDNEQGDSPRIPDSSKDESEQNSKLKTSKSTKPINKNVHQVDKDGEDKKC